MGFSSEMHIEMHNEMLESDESYREDYERWCEELEWQMVQEEFDLFGYKMDYLGYTEVFGE